MIAAEKDRNGTGSGQLISARAQGADPALDLPVVLRVVGRSVGELGHVADRKIPVIAHLKTQAVEHSQETSSSQRRGSHQGSALRRADFDRRAEERNTSRQI